MPVARRTAHGLSWRAPDPATHPWLRILKPLGFETTKNVYKDHGHLVTYWVAQRDAKMASGQLMRIIVSGYPAVDSEVGVTIYRVENNGRTPIGIWNSRPLSMPEIEEALREIVKRVQEAEAYPSFNNRRDERDALQTLHKYTLTYPLE